MFESHLVVSKFEMENAFSDVNVFESHLVVSKSGKTVEDATTDISLNRTW